LGADGTCDHETGGEWRSDDAAMTNGTDARRRCFGEHGSAAPV
jgi:hypothetical protein